MEQIQNLSLISQCLLVKISDCKEAEELSYSEANKQEKGNNNESSLSVASVSHGLVKNIVPKILNVLNVELNW